MCICPCMHFIYMYPHTHTHPCLPPPPLPFPFLVLFLSRSGGGYSSVESYDMYSNTWTHTAPMATPRRLPSAAVRMCVYTNTF